MAVTLITQEELLKLAALSSIKLEAHEVEPLRESLEAVLAYASRLNDIAAHYSTHEEQPHTVNKVRDDNAQPCTENIVSYAHIHENNYFVVPVIIKQ